jgi:DNA-binding NtrC family response regulator
MEPVDRSKLTVLVIDDHPASRETMAEIVRGEGFAARLAPDGELGLNIVRDETVDIVLCDLRLPGVDGLTVLDRMREKYPDVPVVLVTAHGNEDVAVSAMRRGAHDYLSKPLDVNRVRAALESAAKARRMMEENVALRARISELGAFGEIIGSSPQMQRVIDTVRQVARTSASVLITGENGTGKEVVANALHAASDRADKPLIKVAVAALPRELLESELFGHEKGAFTGAYKMKRGRFELADGGTLFLDEIGDMPLETQVKLLRVLQERTFERVGGTEPIKTDIRLICATNQDLEKLMAAGRFRNDLYFRINVIHIQIPPLRERPDDVPALVDRFLAEFRKPGAPAQEFSRDALAAMSSYAWPGNVREVRNVVERATITCRDPVISADHLPDSIRPKGPLPAPSAAAGGFPSIGSSLDDIEKYYITKTLSENGGNKTRAAKALKIGLKTLYRKIEKYGLP